MKNKLGVFDNNQERNEAVFLLYLTINMFDRTKLTAFVGCKGLTKIKKILEKQRCFISSERIRQIIAKNVRMQIKLNSGVLDEN